MNRRRAADTVGKRFGRLLVLKRTSLKRALCQCDCGVRREMDIYGISHGRTKSCGCLHREHLAGIGDNLRTHGRSASREYRAWRAARRRCHNPDDKAYSYYGGRGIVMCEQWRDDFEKFARDMGECPTGFTLERRDVDKGYSPSNCCWIPKHKQASNKRNSVRIEWQGESLTIAEWSRKLGICQKTIAGRLKTGRSIEEVLRPTSLKSNAKPLRGLSDYHLRLKASLDEREPA